MLDPARLIARRLLPPEMDGLPLRQTLDRGPPEGKLARGEPGPRSSTKAEEGRSSMMGVNSALALSPVRSNRQVPNPPRPVQMTCHEMVSDC